MKVMLLTLLCLITIPMSAYARQPDPCASADNPLWGAIPKENSKTVDRMARVHEVIKINALGFDNILTVATWLGYDNILKESLQDKALIKKYGAQTLYVAASMGRLREMSLLLHAGVSANAEGYNRLTPIYGAAEHGCVRAMRLLVERGADVNHKANVHWTLLEDAVISKQYSAARFLMQHGYVLRAGERSRIKAILTRMDDPSALETIFDGAEAGPATSGRPTAAVTTRRTAQVCSVLNGEKHYGSPSFGSSATADSTLSAWVPRAGNLAPYISRLHQHEPAVQRELLDNEIDTPRASDSTVV